MNVLVTGATTPLGHAIIAALLASPDVGHVLAVGAEPWGPGLPSSGDRFAYERVDLTRERSVHDLLYGTARDRGIDSVLHGCCTRRCATAASGSTRSTSSQRAMLVRACERHPAIRRFVLRSGAEVYAARPEEPNLIDEDQPSHAVGFPGVRAAAA